MNQRHQAISPSPRTLVSVVVLLFGSMGVPADGAPPTADIAARSAPRDEFAELQRQIATCHEWDLSRLEKEAVRPEALVRPGDATPVHIVWRRTHALLQHLRTLPSSSSLAREAAALEALRPAVSALRPDAGEPAQRELFTAITRLRRQIAFKNPLLDFDSIIFLKHDKQLRGEIHMVDQYLGFNAAKAGGVYVLEKPFSAAPSVRSLLANSKVQTGRLKGRTLENKGGFISLDLDYDGKTILFGFSEAEWQLEPDPALDLKLWTPLDIGPKQRPRKPGHYMYRAESCYHVFKSRVDGTGLAQLTDGPWNDFDPCWLPNGRIAFISSRSGGQCRCGARPLPSYTLHGMMPDGSDIIQLSWHETNEWHPSIDNHGMLVYTRWDYVDRDSDVAHHLWRCYPDGRDPRSPHGNYPERRESRPWMEMSIRAVPNSTKYVAVAAPHHGEAYGSIVLINLEESDDRSTGQLRRVTPEAHFPESEQAPGVSHVGRGQHKPKGEVYGTPWPLSEDFHLCVYDSAQSNYGIYLVDTFGNRELLYRDPDIACLDPIPLRARPRPHILPTGTIQAKADQPAVADLANGTIAVMNVYESRHAWPAGTRIKELRVVNVFPKDNAMQDVPNMGVAIQSLGRGVLGTAPVEPDGSAYFKVPAGAPLYFQLIDEQGLMVQTMRSATYVHPGERLTCVGCHETSRQAPTQPGTTPPLALRRAPSELKPEPAGSYPLTFPRLVQPVLDQKCVDCHAREPRAVKLGGQLLASGRTQGFEGLRPFAWGMAGGNGTAFKERQYSLPGEEGARVSKLYALLARGHYDVKLSPEELRRITLWLDCNSTFFAAYHDPELQARGEVVLPVHGLPKWTDFSLIVR